MSTRVVHEWKLGNVRYRFVVGERCAEIQRDHGFGWTAYGTPAPYPDDPVPQRAPVTEFAEFDPRRN